MPPIFTSIGNACTDIISTIQDDFLTRHNLRKGLCAHIMSLDELNAMRAEMTTPAIVPGGAGANVAHVISALGGEAHFISKIAADPEGLSFKSHMTEAHVTCHFPPPSPPQSGSSQVLALISPDGERTFASFDGAARSFGVDDYDFDLIASSQYLYLDGYCYASPLTAAGFVKAAQTALSNGHHATFNIGDLSYFETLPDTIRNILSVCDSIVCNLPEAQAFFGNDPIDVIASLIAQRYAFGAITDGAKGAYVFRNSDIVHIPAIDITDLSYIDTNGAGDHFSGGFIFGLMTDMTLEQAGRLGILCARDCISHAGARPLGGHGSLKHLVTQAKS